MVLLGTCCWWAGDGAVTARHPVAGPPSSPRPLFTPHGGRAEGPSAPGRASDSRSHLRSPPAPTLNPVPSAWGKELDDQVASRPIESVLPTCSSCRAGRWLPRTQDWVSEADGRGSPAVPGAGLRGWLEATVSAGRPLLLLLPKSASPQGALALDPLGSQGRDGTVLPRVGAMAPGSDSMTPCALHQGPDPPPAPATPCRQAAPGLGQGSEWGSVSSTGISTRGWGVCVSHPHPPGTHGPRTPPPGTRRGLGKGPSLPPPQGVAPCIPGGLGWAGRGCWAP